MELGAGGRIDQADKFEIEGVEFVPGWVRPSEPGSLSLRKHVGMVAEYRRLFDRHPSPRMVELGIAQGGSVALLALLAKPTRFVALELDPEPVEPLLEMLRERGLESVVTPYFGVDQADKARLRQILDDDFGGEPLDLVVDDASHRYAQTVASFEVLFPRLRPGGSFVIEDWNGQDLVARQMADGLARADEEERSRHLANLEAHMAAVLADPGAEGHAELRAALGAETETATGVVAPRHIPLSRLALEMTLARAGSSGAVSEVNLDENWLTIRRGPADLDPDRFSVADLFEDTYRQLTPP